LSGLALADGSLCDRVLVKGEIVDLFSTRQFTFWLIGSGVIVLALFAVALARRYIVVLAVTLARRAFAVLAVALAVALTCRCHVAHMVVVWSIVLMLAYASVG